ncbi:MAG TPA: DUF885 domain-containing protein [Bryobacteraceae bacterium]|nr:DUF885 domain-containing protein [Bryobacteraceae bacterium]
MNKTAFASLIVVCAAMQAQDSQTIDRFFDEYYAFKPSEATAQGFHQFDDRIEDESASGRARRLRFLHEAEKTFAALPSSPDRDLILNRVRADLLELEQIRMWEKNPDLYSGSAANAVFVIMSRRFAPPAERLRSVIEREKQMPAAFGYARENLKNPPRVYTEVALEQLPGITGFFEHDVPLAFHDVTDQKLLAEFRQANEAVIAALAAYEKWLRDDLLPRSNGDFRIGAGNYRKKLAYEEMVDVPLDELLKVGYEDLRRNQEAFRATAAKLDRHKTPMQVLSELAHDHPRPDHLLQSFRDVLGGLRQYIEAHRIITIPSDVPPIVEETPPFLRALTAASMDTPGPFERVAKEAYFNVTLPDPKWTPKQVEDLMEGFNRGTVVSTAVHEVYPGHYTQFLWVQQAPSKTRKLLGAGSNAEGWAHYCEQMMLDEGYGNGDLTLRLGQLQDALLRNARYIVGIRMHTGTMSFDEGVQFFEKEGYQSHGNALRETKRGTSDPTYLMYTLGKLEILKLRADYQRKMGARYRLGEFHDEFMRQGWPPIAIVREAMLGQKGSLL